MTFAPVLALISVVTPELLVYLIVPAVPTRKSPWTLSIINSLIPVISPTESLMFLPREFIPTLVTVNTSPTEYPVPPLEMVAARATPF